MSDTQLKRQVTESRLSTMDMPAEGWSDAARQAALTRVRSQGLPTRRDEYWKYTHPDGFVVAV
ncbi:MAG: Fe-S cluster assembly protein SufD, partial [Paracoccaceae bacterium]|nr:Fe-S cluster assembly protein SufD [Paracoccaceae bacterium]